MPLPVGPSSQLQEERLTHPTDKYRVLIQYRAYPDEKGQGSWIFTMPERPKACGLFDAPLQSSYHWLLVEEFSRHVGDVRATELIRPIIDTVRAMRSAQDHRAICPSFWGKVCEQHSPHRWTIQELVNIANFGT